LQFLFFIFFGLLILRSLQLDRRALKQMEPSPKRDQIKLFLLSLSIAVLGSIDFLSSLPSLHFYPIGFLPVLVFISLQAYAIVKYKKASLSAIFAAIDDGILVIDKNETIEEANSSMQKIAGMERQDFIGKNLLDALDSYFE